MPYPKQFLRVSWLFTINGTDEIAETGCHVTTLGTAAFDAAAVLATVTPTQMQTLIGYMANVVNSDATNIFWAAYSRLVGLKVAAVGVDGHYLAEPKVRDTSTSYAGVHEDVPAQATIALSLRSASTFGMANYGRMYLPHTMFNTAAGSPYAATAGPAGLAVAGADLITLTNVVANTWLAGAGVVNISKLGAGAVKGVTRVGVGNVTDTQRRRRAQLQELYTFDTV